jgi:hypothetical protein
MATLIHVTKTYSLLTRENKIDILSRTIRQSIGRPKLDPRIKQMFEAKGEEAFHIIATHMQSDDAKISLQAAQLLLERGYGKPAQQLDIGNSDPEGFKTVNEIRNVIVRADPKP